MIYRNHFELHIDDYKKGVLSGLYNAKAEGLSVREITCNKYEVFMGAIASVNPDLHWDKHHKIRDKKAVREKLESESTRLFLLLDNNQSVGFAVVKPVAQELKDKYFRAANDNGYQNVIEIDYLAMYEGEEGKGRGMIYFSTLFDDLFRSFDKVYWSQHSTNAPTLGNYYRDKMGMTQIDREYIEDFRVG